MLLLFSWTKYKLPHLRPLATPTLSLSTRYSSVLHPFITPPFAFQCTVYSVVLQQFKVSLVVFLSIKCITRQKTQPKRRSYLLKGTSWPAHLHYDCKFKSNNFLELERRKLVLCESCRIKPLQYCIIIYVIHLRYFCGLLI